MVCLQTLDYQEIVNQISKQKKTRSEKELKKWRLKKHKESMKQSQFFEMINKTETPLAKQTKRKTQI